MIINNETDLQQLAPGAEHTVFLQGLLDDYTVFDDAVYPQNYDHALQSGDPGYVAPILRQEWNTIAAAAWGFNSRAEIEATLATI